MAVKRALISVSDKTGIVEFAKGLHELGVEIISTGGTMKAIADAGIPVMSVSEVTGFPEMMDGRVKTLHPKIHGGILAVRDNPAHVKALEEHGITGIDLVAVNLYPSVKQLQDPMSHGRRLLKILISAVLPWYVRRQRIISMLRLSSIPRSTEKCWNGSERTG